MPKSQEATPPAAGPLAIVYRPLKSLVPYAKNSRTHSRVQLSQIKASLLEYGWTNPMLVADGGIIAGHGRLVSALELAEEGHAIPGNPDPWSAPTVDLSHLTKNQRRAYVIADNQLALQAGWDDEILAMELGELAEEGYDLGLTGFGDEDIARLLGGSSPGTGADPDDVPSVPVHPVSQPGDVWIMGRHRIICGDSTDADTVAKVLAGVRPHLMVTDPPYGVSYDPEWRNQRGLAATKRKGKVENDDKENWQAAYALFPGDVAYVWHGEQQCPEVALNLRACGFQTRNLIVWAKPRLVISRGNYHRQHETCWYAVRNKGHWAGDRKQTTLWQIDPKGQDTETEHSTQKPVECMKRPIENNSSAGQAVYEPFSGSGTTIIACEITGRSCHAVELNPAYVDVAVRRWQNVSGAVATLEGDGRSFDEISMARPTEAAPADKPSEDTDDGGEV